MSLSPSNRLYYPYFDYLRAFCAITVMLYHAQVLNWKNSGDLAVQIFFALSGWLIGGALIHLKTSELYRFYFNRAIRIWAPYYIALGLAIGLSILRDPINEKWLEIVIYKLTFVYNIFGTPQLAQHATEMPLKATLNHVWSVNAEEQFYLIAPLLLVVGSKFFGKNPITWIALATGSILLNTYPAIVLGVLFSILAAHPKIQLKPTSAVIRVTLLIALSIATPALFSPSLYELFAPIFSISLVLLLAIPGKKSGLGEIAGGMSYPLYLNHWIGVYAINFLLPNLRATLAGSILSSTLSICIATSMYLLIEKKMLENRSYWYSKTMGENATLLAYSLLIIGSIYGFFNLYRSI